MKSDKEIITIEMDSSEFNSYHQLNNQPGEELKLWAAVGLFQAGKVSLSKAASIAGLSRINFENFLTENNIPISNITISDLEKDIRLIHSASKG